MCKGYGGSVVKSQGALAMGKIFRATSLTSYCISISLIAKRYKILYFFDFCTIITLFIIGIYTQEFIAKPWYIHAFVTIFCDFCSGFYRLDCRRWWHDYNSSTFTCWYITLASLSNKQTSKLFWEFLGNFAVLQKILI